MNTHELIERVLKAETTLPKNYLVTWHDDPRLVPGFVGLTPVGVSLATGKALSTVRNWLTPGGGLRSTTILSARVIDRDDLIEFLRQLPPPGRPAKEGEK